MITSPILKPTIGEQFVSLGDTSGQLQRLTQQIRQAYLPLNFSSGASSSSSHVEGTLEERMRKMMTEAGGCLAKALSILKEVQTQVQAHEKKNPSTAPVETLKRTFVTLEEDPTPIRAIPQSSERDQNAAPQAKRSRGEQEQRPNELVVAALGFTPGLRSLIFKNRKGKSSPESHTQKISSHVASKAAFMRKNAQPDEVIEIESSQESVQEISPLSSSKATPVSTQKTLCAGLVNRNNEGKNLNRCCLYSVLKMLWSTTGVRSLVSSSETPMARALRELFKLLDTTTQRERMYAAHYCLTQIIELLEQKGHNIDLSSGRQQDAQEILNEIISQVTPEHPLFSYMEMKTSSSAPLFLNFLKPQKLQGLVLTSAIPKENSGWNLQKDFDGVPLRQIATPADVAAGSDRAAVSTFFKTSQEQEVSYTQSKHFLGDPPSCLFIQLLRFALESKQQLEAVQGVQKRTDAVTPLYILNVPCKNGAERKPYRLSSVVVHKGTTTNNGHYYSCIPDHSSTGVDGIPTRWFRHDDEKVTAVPFSSIEEDLRKNGYLFAYEPLST